MNTSTNTPDMFMNTPDHEVSTRPRWTLSEAARRTGTSRATLLRRIESGHIPGAQKTDNGWSIGVEDLLAAGFHPDGPRPPTDERPRVRGHVHEHVQVSTDTVQRIVELERDLAVAHAQRTAAEQVAAERERIIEAQAMALRMLEARPPDTGDAKPDLDPTTAPAPPPKAASTKTKLGILTRVRNLLADSTGRSA